MGAVWTLNLPLNEQAVLLAMADHGKDDGSDVFPSNAYIAWKLGVSLDTVRRIRRKLEDKRVLVLVNAEPGRVWKYRIDIDAGQRKPPYNPKHTDRPEGVTPPANCTPLKRTQNPPQPERQPPANETEPPAQLCTPNHITIKEPSKPSETQEAIALWIQAFNQWNPSPYRNTVAKRRKADELGMAALIKSGMTAKRIGELAQTMFRSVHEQPFKGLWWSSKCRTIENFCHRLNEIEGELKPMTKTASGPTAEDLADQEEREKYGSSF